MKHRLTMVVLLTALTVGAAACGPRQQEPEGPTPEQLEQERLEAERRAAEEARLRAEREAEEARRRAEAERARAVQVETAAAREILEQRVHFDFDRSNIRPDAEQTLMRKLAVLRANPEARIRIEGHADERGSIEYNLALGQRRAEAVRDFLTGFGIPANRIETVSFGEDRPLVRESNERAWAQNRRAEFRIIAGGDQLRNPGG